jgi:hypothetical protein
LTNCWRAMDGLTVAWESRWPARYKTCFIMVGHMTIMYLICFFSLQMVRFEHAILMHLAPLHEFNHGKHEHGL